MVVMHSKEPLACLALQAIFKAAYSGDVVSAKTNELKGRLKLAIDQRLVFTSCDGSQQCYWVNAIKHLSGFAGDPFDHAVTVAICRQLVKAGDEQQRQDARGRRRELAAPNPHEPRGRHRPRPDGPRPIRPRSRTSRSLT